MADTSIFFQANDPLGLTGWVAQSGGDVTVTEQNAVALGANGDSIAEQGYDPKQELSVSYIATGNGVAIPSVGDILNGWHVDSVSVSWSNTDWAKLTISAHKHGTAAHETCRVYEPTITATGGFGCPTAIGLFTLGTTSGVGVRSVSYSLQTNHVDEMKHDGSHLAGDNYDGTETLTIETTGAYTFPASSDGWHNDSADEKHTNTGATTTSCTYTKHLQAKVTD